MVEGHGGIEVHMEEEVLVQSWQRRSSADIDAKDLKEVENGDVRGKVEQL